jgi:hypothetical protein
LKSSEFISKRKTTQKEKRSWRNPGRQEIPFEKNMIGYSIEGLTRVLKIIKDDRINSVCELKGETSVAMSFFSNDKQLVNLMPLPIIAKKFAS